MYGGKGKKAQFRYLNKGLQKKKKNLYSFRQCCYICLCLSRDGVESAQWVTSDERDRVRMRVVYAGMTSLVSLNISNSKITNSGLHHLTPLHNLTSLALQGCEVTLPAVAKLQASSLPNLTVIRVRWDRARHISSHIKFVNLFAYEYLNTCKYTICVNMLEMYLCISWHIIYTLTK